MDKARPTSLATDTRRVGINNISSPSMSCPHVSRLAALFQSAHPEWCPAVVRSALMTKGPRRTRATSTTTWHEAPKLDPARPLDPGMVYELGTRNYVDLISVRAQVQLHNDCHLGEPGVRVHQLLRKRPTL